MTETLRDLRQKIDQLDDDILALVRERLNLSAAISAAKQHNDIFRPGREAEIMHRLTAQAPEVDPAIIVSIWRQIVSGSIAQQDGTTHMAVEAKSLPTAIWHFANAMQIDHCSDLAGVMAAMDAGTPLAMVPCDAAPALAAALYACTDRFIIAKTPLFAVDAVHPSYILGRGLPDESGNDASIFALPDDEGYQLVVVAGVAADATDAGLPELAKLIGRIAC